MRVRQGFMAGVVVAAITLGIALASTALSAGQLVLFCAAAPLIVYFALRDIEVPVRQTPKQPFSVVMWDCRVVVLVPLAILIPYGTAALLAGVLAVVVGRTQPPRHPALVDTYNGGVHCLALLASGAVASLVLSTGRTMLGYTAAATAGVLVNEAVTLVLVIGLVGLDSRSSSDTGTTTSDSGSRIVAMIRVAMLLVPVVAALAAATVVSYVDRAYVATAVVVLAPIAFIELLRGFGQTSIALESRDRDRDDVLRLIVESAEQQRQFLAEELHDGPLQTVLACHLMLDDDAPMDAARISKWLSRAASDLRDAVRGLVPGVLTERGLEAALRHDAEMLASAFPGGWTLSVRLQRDVGPQTELLLYRVAHEGLVNAARHAHAEHVTVSVSDDDGICVVRVRDDGRGVSTEDITSALERGRLGIAMLRERVALASGTFAVGAAAEGGTELVAAVPTPTDSQVPSGSAAARMAVWWAGLPHDPEPATPSPQPRGPGRSRSAPQTLGP